MHILFQWFVGFLSLVFGATAVAMIAWFFSDECDEFREGLYFILGGLAVWAGLTWGIWSIGGEVLAAFT